MKRMSLFLSLSLAFGLLGSPVVVAQQSQLPTFTYQGRLEDNGADANGPYDLEFTIWDSESGGNQIGAARVEPDYPVVNGVFTLGIDYPEGTFAGDQRWLQVKIEGTVMPRQPIATAPVAEYALHGTAGPQGIQGEAGPQGEIGPVGPPGALDPIEFLFKDLEGAFYEKDNTNFRMIEPLVQREIGHTGILLHLTASVRTTVWPSHNAAFSLCYSSGGGGTVGTPLMTDHGYVFARFLLTNEEHRAVTMNGLVRPSEPGIYWVGLCHSSEDNLRVYTGMGFGLPVSE